ncbi:hypothetical protein BJ742DRAFT_817848 [Cladochytrium replicatum]|nr:hypothetical protein BJ742DRAFT_817848 [Cladochytrium replicatum]
MELNALLQKLDHPFLDIRHRAILSISFKIKSGLLNLDSLLLQLSTSVQPISALLTRYLTDAESDDIAIMDCLGLVSLLSTNESLARMVASDGFVRKLKDIEKSRKDQDIGNEAEALIEKLFLGGARAKGKRDFEVSNAAFNARDESGNHSNFNRLIASERATDHGSPKRPAHSGTILRTDEMNADSWLRNGSTPGSIGRGFTELRSFSPKGYQISRLDFQRFDLHMDCVEPSITHHTEAILDDLVALMSEPVLPISSRQDRDSAIAREEFRLFDLARRCLGTQALLLHKSFLRTLSDTLLSLSDSRTQRSLTYLQTIALEFPVLASSHPTPFSDYSDVLRAAAMHLFPRLLQLLLRPHLEVRNRSLWILYRLIPFLNPHRNFNQQLSHAECEGCVKQLLDAALSILDQVAQMSQELSSDDTGIVPVPWIERLTMFTLDIALELSRDDDGQQSSCSARAAIGRILVESICTIPKRVDFVSQLVAEAVVLIQNNSESYNSNGNYKEVTDLVVTLMRSQDTSRSVVGNQTSWVRVDAYRCLCTAFIVNEKNRNETKCWEVAQGWDWRSLDEVMSTCVLHGIRDSHVQKFAVDLFHQLLELRPIGRDRTFLISLFPLMYDCDTGKSLTLAWNMWKDLFSHSEKVLYWCRALFSRNPSCRRLAALEVLKLVARSDGIVSRTVSDRDVSIVADVFMFSGARLASLGVGLRDSAFVPDADLVLRLWTAVHNNQSSAEQTLELFKLIGTKAGLTMLLEHRSPIEVCDLLVTKLRARGTRENDEHLCIVLLQLAEVCNKQLSTFASDQLSTLLQCATECTAEEERVRYILTRTLFRVLFSPLMTLPDSSNGGMLNENIRVQEALLRHCVVYAPVTTFEAAVEVPESTYLAWEVAKHYRSKLKFRTENHQNADMDHENPEKLTFCDMVRERMSGLRNATSYKGFESYLSACRSVFVSDSDITLVDDLLEPAVSRYLSVPPANESDADVLEKLLHFLFELSHVGPASYRLLNYELIPSVHRIMHHILPPDRGKMADRKDIEWSEQLRENLMDTFLDFSYRVLLVAKNDLTRSADYATLSTSGHMSPIFEMLLHLGNSYSQNVETTIRADWRKLTTVLDTLQLFIEHPTLLPESNGPSLLIRNSPTKILSSFVEHLVVFMDALHQFNGGWRAGDEYLTNYDGWWMSSRRVQKGILQFLQTVARTQSSSIGCWSPELDDREENLRQFEWLGYATNSTDHGISMAGATLCFLLEPRIKGQDRFIILETLAKLQVAISSNCCPALALHALTIMIATEVNLEEAIESSVTQLVANNFAPIIGDIPGLSAPQDLMYRLSVSQFFRVAVSNFLKWTIGENAKRDPDMLASIRGEVLQHLDFIVLNYISDADNFVETPINLIWALRVILSLGRSRDGEAFAEAPTNQQLGSIFDVAISRMKHISPDDEQLLEFVDATADFLSDILSITEIRPENSPERIPTNSVARFDVDKDLSPIHVSIAELTEIISSTVEAGKSLSVKCVLLLGRVLSVVPSDILIKHLGTKRSSSAILSLCVGLIRGDSAYRSSDATESSENAQRERRLVFQILLSSSDGVDETAAVRLCKLMAKQLENEIAGEKDLDEILFLASGLRHLSGRHDPVRELLLRRNFISIVCGLLQFLKDRCHFAMGSKKSKKSNSLSGLVETVPELFRSVLNMLTIGSKQFVPLSQKLDLQLLENSNPPVLADKLIGGRRVTVGSSLVDFCVYYMNFYWKNGEVTRTCCELMWLLSLATDTKLVVLKSTVQTPLFNVFLRVVNSKELSMSSIQSSWFTFYSQLTQSRDGAMFVLRIPDFFEVLCDATLRLTQARASENAKWPLNQVISALSIFRNFATFREGKVRLAGSDKFCLILREVFDVLSEVDRLETSLLAQLAHSAITLVLVLVWNSEKVVEAMRYDQLNQPIEFCRPKCNLKASVFMHNLPFWYRTADRFHGYEMARPTRSSFNCTS